MANIDENFVVKTGLTVGPTVITASTGNLATTGNITVGGTVINGATGDVTVGPTTINGVTGAITTTGNVVTTGSFIANGTVIGGGASSFNGATITNSTINGTPIGATTAAAGHFTTLDATGTVTTNDILPHVTNVSNIGSPTQRFNTIYVNEAKLSTNTLYIGDTAILGTTNNVINIHADPGQAIHMQTTGAAGTLNFVANAQVTMQSTGNNADILLQSNGTGSKTRILSATQIEETAPSITMVGNVTTTGTSTFNGEMVINGNVNITGSQAAVNASELTVKDNIVIVNAGETGEGVTALGGLSGFQISRGQLSSYRLVFRESDQSLQFGPVGSTAKVITDNGSGSIVSNLIGNVTGNASTATTAGSATTAGTVTAAAQPAITSVGTLTGLTVTGTINGNISGNAATATTAGSATTAATVTAAAQPAITSVGTLTSLVTSGPVTVGTNLTVTGNLTVNGTSTTINAATLDVEDLNITVAKGAATAAAANGAGLTIDGANATMTYGSANDNFIFNKRVDATAFYGPLTGNVTGNATSATTATTATSATTATNATNVGITNDTTTATAQYLTFVGTNTGNDFLSVTSTKLSFVPSTGYLSATRFVGSGAGLTAIPNTALTNSSVTVTAGTGMSGGGTVALGGTVTLDNAGVTQITGGGGISVSGATGAVTLSSTATSANTASAIVQRDASGNFSAGTITASLSGTATLANDIAGGAAWQIPYQTAAGATSFVAAGTTGQILTATTGGAPTWTTHVDVDSIAVSGVGISVNQATGAVTITSNATSANTASTIVARDASGNFSAGVISATSTSARYADLAEKYTSDAAYEPGTVVSFGGDAEVTLSKRDGDRKVAGVVTTAPAYLMNSELEGTAVAIALQGRVPCKVTGKISKGDMLISAGNGYARADMNPIMGQMIGKALEDFDGVNGVIEVAVGRM